MLDRKEMDKKMSNRITWIDFAKGITILLVIIGHCVGEGLYGGLLRGVIFSFHMPLFFILSCTTYRCSETIEEYKRKVLHSARHLLIPAIAAFGACIAFQCVKTNSFGDLSFWKGKFFTLIFASGVKLSYNGFEVAAMGIPWFFFALFLGRAIFDFIYLICKEDKKTLLFCLILGMIGILYGKIQWMPFSLDIALAILPFFFYGYQLKKLQPDRKPFWKLLVWGGIWLISLGMTFTANYTYLELAARRYTLFPICCIAAIAGTMAMSEFSILFCRWKKIAAPFVFIGRYSMYLLCIHILDGCWKKWWYIQNHQFDTAIWRVLVDLILFFLIVLGKKLWEKINSKKKP